MIGRLFLVRIPECRLWPNDTPQPRLINLPPLPRLLQYRRTPIVPSQSIDTRTRLTLLRPPTRSTARIPSLVTQSVLASNLPRAPTRMVQGGVRCLASSRLRAHGRERALRVETICILRSARVRLVDSTRREGRGRMRSVGRGRGRGRGRGSLRGGAEILGERGTGRLLRRERWEFDRGRE